MANGKDRCAAFCKIKLLELTPPYSPQSIGTVANMQRLIGGQLRTTPHRIETEYAYKVKPDMNMWSWIRRHAAWLMETVHVKMKGHTVYRDLTGTAYDGELVFCGETFLFSVSHSASGCRAGGPRLRRADYKHEMGIFVGKDYKNDE